MKMKKGRTAKDGFTLIGFVKLTLVLTIVLTLIMLALPVALETISNSPAGASAADFTQHARRAE
jgi:competence protein ComGC